MPLYAALYFSDYLKDGGNVVEAPLEHFVGVIKGLVSTSGTACAKIAPIISF